MPEPKAVQPSKPESSERPELSPALREQIDYWATLIGQIATGDTGSEARHEGIRAFLRHAYAEGYAAARQEMQDAKKSIRAQLIAEGYRPRHHADDAAVCRENPCDKCGHPFTTYNGLTKDGSYRAVSTCPQCGDEVEF